MQPNSAHPSKWCSTRRQLLGSGMSGVGLALLPRQPGLCGEEPGNDLIDAHVHVWTPDTQKYPLSPGFTKADMQPPSFTAEELMSHARPCGVGRVVLIQMSFYQFDNSYMLATMRHHPAVYSGVAVVDETKAPADEMKKLAKQGVRGFRIRPGKRTPAEWLSGDGMQAMWRCGAEQGLAMCHLINPEYLPSVERMCRKYPRTPVVIDHFARIGIDGNIRAADLDNLCRLARFPQVSLKISAFYALGKKESPYHDLAPMIRRVHGAFGPERLMWASDCPYQVQDAHTYRASIDLIKQGLDFLTPDDQAWILKKTAERVFFS